MKQGEDEKEISVKNDDDYSLYGFRATNDALMDVIN